MCQFGDESKIISELELAKEEALVGYRNWLISNSFNNVEKYLKSTSIDFLWPKKEEVKGNPSRINSEGIYNNYNYNYNNYNYNYNNYYYNNNNYINYNYYNYYNNYYNYYNYNYNYNNYINYNYYYYNNNNYNICGKTLLYGKVFSYREGFRSSLCIPTHLVILSNKEWFEDKKTVKFANHFNEIVINLAKEYDCEVIGFDEFAKKE